VPHLAQNLEPDALAWPQDGHAGDNAEPHWLQKFASSATSA
jgi:hypothetical protein